MSLQAKSGSPRPATAVELQRVIEAERAGAAFLTFRDGAGELRIVGLPGLGERVTLGRSSGNALVIGWDEEVSRAHVELECVGDEWVAFDEGLSRNGTFVNGERITHRRRLANGDVLRVGMTELVFRAPAPGSAAPTVPAADIVPVRLSDNQRRILAELARPFHGEIGGPAIPPTNRQIADALFLSTETVKMNMRLMVRAFGLTHVPDHEKRVRLVHEALQRGLVG